MPVSPSGKQPGNGNASRPYFSWTNLELSELVDKSSGNMAVLRAIESELGHRDSKSARKLLTRLGGNGLVPGPSVEKREDRAPVTRGTSRAVWDKRLRAETEVEWDERTALENRIDWDELAADSLFLDVVDDSHVRERYLEKILDRYDS